MPGLPGPGGEKTASESSLEAGSGPVRAFWLCLDQIREMPGPVCYFCSFCSSRISIPVMMRVLSPPTLILILESIGFHLVG